MNDIENKLAKELSETYNNFDECHKKANNYNINTNTSKLAIATTIGAISFFPSIFLIMPFISTLNISYPIITSLCLNTLSCGVLGYLGQAIITFISRKINKIDDATNQENIEKTMSYQLEQAKSKSKIFAFERILVRIQCKNKITQEYSDTLKINDNQKNLTIQELQQKQTTLLQAYQDNLKELDILTTKEFLHDNFEPYRTKKNRLDKIFQNSSIGFALFAVLIGYPLAAELTPLTTIDSISQLLKLFGISFIPGIISIPFTAMLTNKNNQEYRNVFNNLNRQLGEHSLTNKPNHQLENDLSSLIVTKINEVEELGVLLAETTETLNNLQAISSTNQPTYEKTLNHSQTLDELTPSFVHSKESSFISEDTEEDQDLTYSQNDFPAPSADLKKRIRKMKSS